MVKFYSFLKILSQHKFKIYFFILILVTVITRFDQLGYSHYYGDETKTFYIDKTKPAIDFFLKQRKGPMQFFVVWTIEKLTQSYDETINRIPFAIASLLSVIGFYFVVKKLFEKNVYSSQIATIASFMFSLSGFFIAFGRTVQYQSFVLLFGISAVLLFLYKRPVLSGIMLGLGLLSHYDAIFYLIPIATLIFLKDVRDFKKITQFVVSMFLIAAPFYSLYFLSGNFSINTVPYIQNRITGSGALPNNSLLTISTYNPNYLYIIVLAFSLFTIFKTVKNIRNYYQFPEQIVLVCWFLFPFILFEIIFSSPGTHILNYLVPVIILSAVGIIEVFKLLKNKITKSIGIFMIHLIIISITITQINTFTPRFNQGYPWVNDISKNRYQLFLYGFPYERGWKEISQYLMSKRDFDNFYTNDDIETAAFYLYPKPTFKYNPTYYIEVSNNQQFKTEDTNFGKVFNYSLEKEIFRDGLKVATIYKRGQRK